MKFTFGNHANYKALDDKTYPAVVLGRHHVPQEGDYFIAYKHCNGEVVITHCWEERLSCIENTSMELLESERRRAIRIAHDSMDAHAEKHKALKAAGSRMAFIEEELANECRMIANTIDGGNAVSYTLGETMRDRIRKEYAMSLAQ